MIQLISWNHTSNDAYEMLKSNNILKSSAWKHQEMINNYAHGILLSLLCGSSRKPHDRLCKLFAHTHA